jgi:hypothetical protein
MSKTLGLALVHCLVQVDEILKDDPRTTGAQTRTQRTVKRWIQVLAHQMIVIVPLQDENDLLSNSSYRMHTSNNIFDFNHIKQYFRLNHMRYLYSEDKTMLKDQFKWENNTSTKDNITLFLLQIRNRNVRNADTKAQCSRTRPDTRSEVVGPIN